MIPAKVGDLVTAENVSGLPIGTWVEWTSVHYGRVSASKIAIDAWTAISQDQTFHFRDTDIASGVPTYVSAMPEPVVTIPAAELARLREIEQYAQEARKSATTAYGPDHPVAAPFNIIVRGAAWGALCVALDRKCS